MNFLNNIFRLFLNSKKEKPKSKILSRKIATKTSMSDNSHKNDLAMDTAFHEKWKQSGQPFIAMEYYAQKKIYFDTLLKDQWSVFNKAHNQTLVDRAYQKALDSTAKPRDHFKESTAFSLDGFNVNIIESAIERFQSKNTNSEDE